MQRTTLLTLLTLLGVTTATAGHQEENFVAVAKRGVNQNKITLKATNPWSGAALFGASTQGRSLPDILLNYKKDKWTMKGELSFDIGRLVQDKDNDTEYKGATGTTGFQMNAESDDINYTNQKLNLDFTYEMSKADELQFSIFEIYKYNNTQTSTIQSSSDAQQVIQSRYFEDKTNIDKNFNMGVLAQYKHIFGDKSSLAGRVYFKYDNNPVMVDYNLWKSTTTYTIFTEKQHYWSADPKMQVVYLSAKKNGFSWGVREKAALLKTHVDNETSVIKFNTQNSMTSGEVNYEYKDLALRAYGAFDYYHQNMSYEGDQTDNDLTRNFFDPMFGASATQKLGDKHTFMISYDRSVARPTYLQLYPLAYVGTGGLGVSKKGNPNLDPSTTQQVKVDYKLKFPTWNIEALFVYKNVDKDFTWTTNTTTNESGDKVSYKTWTNDDRMHTFLFQLNGEVKAGCFDMTMGAHVKRIQYAGDIEIDKPWSFSFKARPKVELPDKWTVSCVLLYTGKEQTLHNTVGDYFYSALRVRKMIGNWGLYAMVQDIAHGNEETITTSAKSTVTSDVDYHSRAVIFGVSYQF